MPVYEVNILYSSCVGSSHLSSLLNILYNISFALMDFFSLLTELKSNDSSILNFGLKLRFLAILDLVNMSIILVTLATFQLDISQ